MKKSLFFIIYRPNSQEYKDNIGSIKQAVKQHRANLVPGKPQLNWCDKSVMVSKDWQI
jgi:hypothetical protein